MLPVTIEPPKKSGKLSHISTWELFTSPPRPDRGAELLRRQRNFLRDRGVKVLVAEHGAFASAVALVTVFFLYPQAAIGDLIRWHEATAGSRGSLVTAFFLLLVPAICAALVHGLLPLKKGPYSRKVLPWAEIGLQVAISVALVAYTIEGGSSGALWLLAAHSASILMLLIRKAYVRVSVRQMRLPHALLVAAAVVAAEGIARGQGAPWIVALSTGAWVGILVAESGPRRLLREKS